MTDTGAGTPLTAEVVRQTCSVSLYRKTARTLISDNTFPPGTTFQTPEGLRAEDEETRAALDVQGGVYPIRESVFRESYVLDDARPATEGLLRSVIVDVLGDALDGYGDPGSWADVILNKYAALAASDE